MLNHNKIFKYIFIVMAIILALLAFFLFKSPKKPEIVDFFACSDYCPEPKENYTIKIYKGVATKKECEKLNGEFFEFYGWKKYQVCKVK